MAEERAERVPAQGAAHVLQRVPRVPEQVMLDRLAVFLNRCREAYDSPSEIPMAFMDSSFQTFTISLYSSIVRASKMCSGIWAFRYS